MKTIEELRSEIDQIDKDIIQLLDKRFNICKDVGLCKKNSGSNVYDITREGQIYSKIDSLSPVYNEEIKAVYEKMMSVSKQMQNKLLGG